MTVPCLLSSIEGAQPPDLGLQEFVHSTNTGRGWRSATTRQPRTLGRANVAIFSSHPLMRSPTQKCGAIRGGVTLA